MRTAFHRQTEILGLSNETVMRSKYPIVGAIAGALATVAPAQAGPEAIPMEVATKVAIVCDQLLAAKVADELLKQGSFKALSEIKNCVTLPAGTRVTLMGVAPGGFVYVVKPPDDAHGAWTKQEWLRQVK